MKFQIFKNTLKHKEAADRTFELKRTILSTVSTKLLVTDTRTIKFKEIHLKYSFIIKKSN